MSGTTGGGAGTQAASTRHWIGVVFVYVLIPLILLKCGGDLGWWQAWLYSVLIMAPVSAGACGRNSAIPD